MITKASTYIALFGENFSPSQAEKNIDLTFTDKHEVGEIGSKGRFKGRAFPFGHAVIEAPPEKEEAEQFTWLLDSVLPHIEALRGLGVTRGKVHVTYAYDSQCNLEFDPQVVARLAKLGLKFTITCNKE